MAQAVDSAGFKASEIKIWARGTVEKSDGELTFMVSGSNQTLPLKGEVAKIKAGEEVTVVGNIEFDKTPSTLVVESLEK